MDHSCGARVRGRHFSLRECASRSEWFEVVTNTRSHRALFVTSQNQTSGTQSGPHIAFFHTGTEAAQRRSTTPVCAAIRGSGNPRLINVFTYEPFELTTACHLPRRKRRKNSCWKLTTFKTLDRNHTVSTPL